MSYNSWVIPIYKNTPVFDYVTNVYAIWCQLFILSRRDETVKPKTCYSTRIYKCHASSPMAHACWLGFPVTPTGSHWSTHCHSLVKYLLSIRRLPGIWGETGIGGCGVLDLGTCETQLCTTLPNSVFAVITSVTCNWPWRKCSHLSNQRHYRSGLVFSESASKHLLTHH